ncbi:hypothetical protein KCU61_g484, partial [Aureobasidium melanogenum]
MNVSVCINSLEPFVCVKELLVEVCTIDDVLLWRCAQIRMTIQPGTSDIHVTGNFLSCLVPITVPVLLSLFFYFNDLKATFEIPVHASNVWLIHGDETFANDSAYTIYFSTESASVVRIACRTADLVASSLGLIFTSWRQSIVGQECRRRKSRRDAVVVASMVCCLNDGFLDWKNEVIDFCTKGCIPLTFQEYTQKWASFGIFLGEVAGSVSLSPRRQLCPESCSRDV